MRKLLSKFAAGQYMQEGRAKHGSGPDVSAGQTEMFCRLEVNLQASRILLKEEQ